MTMTIQPPAPNPPSIWERLAGITIRKRRSANAKHFAFVRDVAAGKELSDRQAEEFHGCTAAAGYTDADTSAHVALVQRIAAAEAAAKRTPSLLEASHKHEAEAVAMEQQMAALAARISQERERSRELAREFHATQATASQMGDLKAQLAELEAE